MDIGGNIRRLREERKISQAELARRVGVTQPFLNGIEKGTKTLSLPLGKVIAQELDVSINEFIV